MGILEIIIIGLGLSMDAFAVTLANAASVASSGQRLAPGGAQEPPNPAAKPRNTLLAAPFVFGLFQGLMPLVGFFAVTFVIDFAQSNSLFLSLSQSLFGGDEPSFAGLPLGDLLLSVIGAVILWIVGLKMVISAVQALRHPEEKVLETSTEIGVSTLVAQGVATSLDALMVGVSLAAANVQIGLAATLIALTTLVCCLLALPLGRRFGLLLGEKSQLAGGIVLVAIGLKILLF